ncbi:MAG: Re/Si-specific NAD(P)(+) transhydrogenase subunit alpha [Ginsengibacter sp.]
MTIGILRENNTETRVSLLPEHLSILQKLNTTILVEKGAGEKAFATNETYIQSGATMMSRSEVINQSDLILSIHLPAKEESDAFQNKVILGNYLPLYFPEEIQLLTEKKVTVFSLDMIPRTTRAQSMDILSSQANIAGYKAVLIAAEIFPKYFPMFMTAAGNIPPAKVLIIGAGVAGLQAIATARRLGAVVEVFDTRPAVKEEVKSLGAKFVEVEGAADAANAGGYAVLQSEEFLQKQKLKIASSTAKADIIITTAQIFGKKAPVLISKEMIETMKNGSVIIDLASATGGNTELTKDNETVNYNGVTIIGNSNLAATMPSDASKLYGKNILNFLALIIDKEGQLNLNYEDELVKGTRVNSV